MGTRVRLDDPLEEFEDEEPSLDDVDPDEYFRKLREEISRSDIEDKRRIKNQLRETRINERVLRRAEEIPGYQPRPFNPDNFQGFEEKSKRKNKRRSHDDGDYNEDYDHEEDLDDYEDDDDDGDDDGRGFYNDHDARDEEIDLDHSRVSSKQRKREALRQDVQEEGEDEESPKISKKRPRSVLSDSQVVSDKKRSSKRDKAEKEGADDAGEEGEEEGPARKRIKAGKLATINVVDQEDLALQILKRRGLL